MVTSERLFGTKLQPVNAAELSRLVGVSHKTISNWKKNPGSIPWEKMKLLIRVRGLTADEVMKMARER